MRAQTRPMHDAFTDTTLPTGPVQRTIIWHAPFTRSDRETDYRTVWEKLASRPIV